MADTGLVSVNLQGIDPVRRALDRVANVEGWRGPLNFLLHGRMKMHVRETFDKQRDPVNGQSWLPVQPFGHGADPSHKILQSNAGAGLIGSIMAAPLTVEGDSIILQPGAGIVYANIHQFGGTNTPKSAKNLALPISKEAHTAGRARRWWAQQSAKGRKPFVYRSKTGKKSLFLATTGEGGKLELHWLLRKSVTIPARPYFGWGDSQRADIGKNALRYLQKVARDAGLDAQSQGDGR